MATDRACSSWRHILGMIWILNQQKILTVPIGRRGVGKQGMLRWKFPEAKSMRVHGRYRHTSGRPESCHVAP